MTTRILTSRYPEITDTGLEGNSRRRRNKKAITNGTRLHLSKQNYFWLLKESKFVTSLRQDSTPSLKHVPCFDCISEQDELRSNDGREGLNERVKLPSIVACGSATNQTKPSDKARSMAAGKSLPPLTSKRLPARRKNSVVSNSSALPLLRNSGVVNITNDCDGQLVCPAEPVRANSLPKVTNYSDGFTRGGRRDIN